MDPLFMDEQKLPVSLGRLYTRIKQSHKNKNHKMLTGNEIRRMLQKSIADCKV